MAHLATKGSILTEFDESQRELMLSLLAGYFESLLALQKFWPESNIGPAWDEATRIKRILEGEMQPHRRAV